MSSESAFISERVLVGGHLKPAVVVVDGGIITSISDRLASDFKGKVHDFGAQVLAPGLVDSHVHINEPGRTEWEGFKTATDAAAAGGITTVVDMPLNCTPVTTSVAALKTKLAEISDQLAVDCAFWGGATPESLDGLDELVQGGVVGVKAFLIDSGIDDFRPLDWDGVDRALPVLAKQGLPFLFHAEWETAAQVIDAPMRSYDDFVKSRPNAWEDRAIEKLIEASKKHNAWIHIVHLSSASALPAIRQAKDEGVKITAETCPHYLCLDAESIDNEQDSSSTPLFKCCPPIRSKENQRALWQGLRDRTIDFIVSDHSPCTPALKNLDSGDLAGAWGGIASLQLGLSLIWSAAEPKGWSLAEVLGMMTEGPARLLPKNFKKGRIAVGYDADFAVFDPSKELTITKSMLHQRHKNGPYMGRKLKGKVMATYLRGNRIFGDDQIESTRRGRCLLNQC